MTGSNVGSSGLITLGPRPGTARRFAPRFRSAAGAARRPRSGSGWGRGTRLPAAPGSGIETSLPASGGRRQVPIGRYLFVKGENPPFHTFPRKRGQRTEFAAISFCALGSTRSARLSLSVRRADGYGNAGELPWKCRPTGTRTTRMLRDSGALASSPGGGLRPASRGSAKPAPMTPHPANVRAAFFDDGRGCAGGPDPEGFSRWSPLTGGAAWRAAKPPKPNHQEGAPTDTR